MAMPLSWQVFVHRYAERAVTLADYSKALALMGVARRFRTCPMAHSASTVPQHRPRRSAHPH